MAMFKYLLETSTCIELLRGNKHVRQKCVEHNQLCCISAITAIELLYGAYDAPEQAGVFAYEVSCLALGFQIILPPQDSLF